MNIRISEVFPTLSKRQREVCALLIAGRSNAEIGLVLNMGQRTVETHRYAIFDRVGAESVSQLAWKAFGYPVVTA